MKAAAAVIAALVLGGCAGLPHGAGYDGGSFPWSSMSIRGRSLAVLDFGDPAARVTVLAVHGWGGSALEFAPLAPLLPRDVRLVAADLPGTGDSAPVNAHEYGTELFVSAMRDLVEKKALGPVVLVGHSIGSKTAVTFAARFPEAVRALVLIAPLGLSRQERNSQRALASWPWLGRLVARLNNRWAAAWGMRHRVYYDGKRIPDWLEERLIDNQLSPSGRAALAAVAHAMIGRNPIDGLLPRVTQPTLILWGRNDRTVLPDAAPRFMAALPRARLRLIDRCGHVPTVERPAETALVLTEFLRDNLLLGE